MDNAAFSNRVQAALSDLVVDLMGHDDAEWRARAKIVKFYLEGQCSALERGIVKRDQEARQSQR